MTQSKHTPGPWKICNKFKHQEFYEIEHPDRHTPGAASLVVARVTCRPSWIEEQTANARLIAESPTMHDLLLKLQAVRSPRELHNLRCEVAEVLARIDGAN